MRAVAEDRDWHLHAVLEPTRIVKTMKARELMRLMAESAWQCGDPGMQYDTTINDWHTSANSGRINASNPCFPGDARVHTTLGLLPFAELYERAAAGEEVRVYTHRATAENPGVGVAVTKPLAVMRNGVKPIVQLTFANGQRLRCTPNHRLWTVNRGYVAAENLLLEDKVLLNDTITPASAASWQLPLKIEALAMSWARGGTKVRQALPERWSEALGELTGHLVGDGCMTDKSTIWVYGGDDIADGVLDRHERYLQEIVGGATSDDHSERHRPATRGLGGRAHTPLQHWYRQLARTREARARIHICRSQRGAGSLSPRPLRR